MTTIELNEGIKNFSAHQERFFKELAEFLTFKSISADPARSNDCEQCAHWLKRHIEAIGFKGELISTISKPIVYGEYKVPNAKRTVVFYGHYDVQPPDPLDLWESDPFVATLRDGRIYARGAEDNKGQLFYFLKAAEQLIKDKKLSCNVKLIIEGEEETGSFAIADWLKKGDERVKGDLLVVCDTGMVHDGIGTITMGLRGIVHLTVTLGGLIKDLHSGVHGGVVKNPAAELIKLLATLYSPDGGIAVKGFLDQVPKVEGKLQELVNSFSMPEPLYISQVGVAPTGGESGYSLMERAGLRPTIEINGIHSGYGGPGGKTIIPSTAFAKISSRLVIGQDPARSIKLIEEHLKSHAPKDLKLEISEQSVGGGALSLNPDSPYVSLAGGILKEITAKDPVFIWIGASIPIVAELAKASNAEPLLVGFGLEEDNIHAPNESFSIEQFRSGYLYALMLLSRV